MLQSIAAKAPPEHLREDGTIYGLIFVPSQRAGELVLKCFVELEDIVQSGVRVAALCKEAVDEHEQHEQLRTRPHIIIAMPENFVALLPSQREAESLARHLTAQKARQHNQSATNEQGGARVPTTPLSAQSDSGEGNDATRGESAAGAGETKRDAVVAVHSVEWLIIDGFDDLERRKIFFRPAGARDKATRDYLSDILAGYRAAPSGAAPPARADARELAALRLPAPTLRHTAVIVYHVNGSLKALTAGQKSALLRDFGGDSTSSGENSKRSDSKSGDGSISSSSGARAGLELWQPSTRNQLQQALQQQLLQQKHFETVSESGGGGRGEGRGEANMDDHVDEAIADHVLLRYLAEEHDDKGAEHAGAIRVGWSMRSPSAPWVRCSSIA